MLLLRRMLRNTVTGLLALLLLFEEWGWVPLSAAVAQLARLPLFAWIERKIARLPPRAAMLVFLAPVLALFPVKLLALYLLGRGQPLLGVVVLVTAKVAGTAIVARLFTLTQPALMHLAWFAYWYPRWKDWKDELIALVRQSAVWQAGIRLKARAKKRWSSIRKRYGLARK